MGANAQTSVPLFVANTVLTASQQNLSAATGTPVFATTVTRDAAFGGSNKALAEGQLCYIEASNVVQYYDGAAWATVGPATSGAFTFIAASGAQSAQANIAFNNCFSATYSNYKVLIENLVQSVANNMQIRLRVGGTDTVGSAYYTIRIECNNTPTVSPLASSGVGYWTPSYVSNSTDGTSLALDFFRPFATAATLATTQASRTDNTTTLVSSTSSHYQSSATSFDGFNIVPSSGTVSCTNIRVYGYSNS